MTKRNRCDILSYKNDEEGYLLFQQNGKYTVYCIGAVYAFRNADHNDTIDSGLFKSSSNHLEKAEHIDFSDDNYYDNDGKLK